MNGFESDLAQRLAAIREQGLYRGLRQVDSPQSPRIQVEGKSLLNFSSNDYLGLANDPALKEAAIKAVERFGAGAGSSRLICGSLSPYAELEEALASFKGTEAALSFSSGYAAALGAICALLDKDDIIVIDRLVHACIVDAARLCGAKLRVFRHNDLNDLERILGWASEGPKSKVQSPKSKAGKGGRTLVVTESLFSMDGDRAPLREIVELKDKYGAWLMVDEAHATGLYGPNRRGLAEECGVSERIEIHMGTLGKALGASGGYIAGSRTLIDYLINRARTFIFSTAPVPAAAAAATAGIRFVQSREGGVRQRSLWERVEEFTSLAAPGHSGAGVPPVFAGETAAETGETPAPLPRLPGAIIPLPIGDENAAVSASASLREQGIFIPAIRYPTVARGQARLRLTVTAGHQREDIEQLCCSLERLKLVNPKS